MKTLTIAAISLLILALSCSLYAASAPAPTLTISITKTGITHTPKSFSGGHHVVMLKNMTGSARGIEMTGMDKGGSPYVRFSRVLAPGKSETFKWYFPPEKTVYLRDLTSCVHKSRTCVVATFGGMVSAITPM
jgi:hypothetical protein